MENLPHHANGLGRLVETSFEESDEGVVLIEVELQQLGNASTKIIKSNIILFGLLIDQSLNKPRTGFISHPILIGIP